METTELNQLSCVDQTTKKIKPEKYQAIVDVMNQGLVDLNTRFKFQIGKVEVPIDQAVGVYDLTKFDPQIRGRFMQIHDVKDECGRPLSVNAFNNQGVNFRSALVMEVPEYLRTVYPVRRLTVQYRALPKKIGDCYGDIDPEMIEVDLPVMYIWALCLYVASRLHTPVGLQDGTYRTNAFLGLFNAECNRLEEAGMDLESVVDSNQFRQGGWA
ncbi:virion structural protein [Pseudomonas phage phCDa]|uniref:Uncharacterized protein n=1 Tax=Pseudomonas phage phCDa TaxID=2268587 RepID=A0A2Z5HAC1_9CAUD|nr:virion structural protein [Pseudomonas phage phCDa]AXC36462.1 hypothetical protein phCDa_18 [Pseudomonas phage phCDa]